MAEESGKPEVDFNHSVRYIRFIGVDQVFLANIMKGWGIMMTKGAFFSMLLSGNGCFECLVQEDLADEFLEAVGFPENR